MKKLFSLLLVSFMALSCFVHTKGEPGQPGQPGQPGTSARMEDNFEILLQEQYGGWEEPANMIIDSQSGLEKMYSELNLADVPKVDFSTKAVVALFMGQKNTGGYSIGIKSVTINGDVAEVAILETKPDGMATMALTQPYCIAAIPKTAKVKFNR